MSPREHEAYQLFVLVEGGVERVRLHTPQSASTPRECCETHGTVMTVEDAMAVAPIPHEVAPGGVCRCTYRPAF